MTSHATPPLIQTGTSGQRRRFELIGDRRLRVSERTRRKSRSYVIDVLAIDPRGHTRTYVPWNWLALMLAGAVTALLGWLAPGSDRSSLAVVFVVAGAASLVGAVMIIKGTRRHRIFLSRYARVPLLKLELNQPDSARFKKFVDHMEKTIVRVSKQRNLEKSQHVAGEMRTLRRLSESGVLEPEVYERARARLLEKF